MECEDIQLLTRREDKVNSPSHYRRETDPVLESVRASLIQGSSVVNLECFDAMISCLSTVDQIRGYLRGNSFKYRYRYEDKDRIESLKKANWYEEKLRLLEQTIEDYVNS